MHQNHRVMCKTIKGMTALCAVLSLGACATWQDNVQSQVDNAKKVIDTAKAAGAERYAPEVVRTADAYAAQASEFISLGKFQEASRTAQQALATGQLAQERTATASRSADIQALRSEISNLQ